MVPRRNYSQTFHFIKDYTGFKFISWGEMGVEAVQALALPVAYSVIDNDGPAQKIIDNIDQPAPV